MSAGDTPGMTRYRGWSRHAGSVTTRIDKRLDAYLQAGYPFAAGDTAGGRRQEVQGNVGVRYTWECLPFRGSCINAGPWLLFSRAARGLSGMDVWN